MITVIYQTKDLSDNNVCNPFSRSFDSINERYSWECQQAEHPFLYLETLQVEQDETDILPS